MLLFKAKNDFVYTVLLYSIQTAVGKGIVRKFIDAKDGQKAWEALIKEQKESSASVLQADDYMTYLTIARLEPSMYHKSLVSWFAYWEECVCRLQNLQPNTYSPEILKKLIQNAVQPHPAFAEVKALQLQLQTRDGSTHRDIGYEAYLQLLKSHAATLDQKSSAKSHVDYKASKKVNFLDMTPTDFIAYFTNCHETDFEYYNHSWASE